MTKLDALELVAGGIPAGLWEEYFEKVGRLPARHQSPAHHTPWSWYDAGADPAGMSAAARLTFLDAGPACRVPTPLFALLPGYNDTLLQGEALAWVEGRHLFNGGREAYVAYYRTEDSAHVNLLYVWLLAGKPTLPPP